MVNALEGVVCGDTLGDIESVGSHVASIGEGEEARVNDGLCRGLGNADIGHEAGELGGAGFVVADEGGTLGFSGAEHNGHVSCVCILAPKLELGRVDNCAVLDDVTGHIGESGQVDVGGGEALDLGSESAVGAAGFAEDVLTCNCVALVDGVVCGICGAIVARPRLKVSEGAAKVRSGSTYEPKVNSTTERTHSDSLLVLANGWWRAQQGTYRASSSTVGVLLTRTPRFSFLIFHTCHH